jgi:hypothetical protein
VIEPLVKAQ